MKISFIQPSRNNLKYLKWSYNAIRKNQGEHTAEICVADDFSSDGTWEWCQEMIGPGGDDHQEALHAAQEDADEQWQEFAQDYAFSKFEYMS